MPAHAFYIGIATAKRFQIDPQDQELLDKQMRNFHASPRRDGVLIAAILAMFFAGIIIGGVLAEPHEGAERCQSANPRLKSTRRKRPAIASLSGVS